MVFRRPFAGFFFFSEYSHVPEFAKNKSVSLRVADGNGEVSRKKSRLGSGTHHAQSRTGRTSFHNCPCYVMIL